MQVFSHRGYHAHHAENTLDAFLAAAELGVDGIETDLRLSADGQIVLYHDRAAPDGRWVADLTRQELTAASGRAVPTLDQALGLDFSGVWMLELKTPAVVPATVAALRPWLGRRKLLVTSFWHNAVVAVREQLELPCGLLMCARPHAPLSFLPELFSGALQMIVWYCEFLDEPTIAAVRHQGMQNFVYGPVTPADHQRCRAMQVDGVITDEPRLA